MHSTKHSLVDQLQMHLEPVLRMLESTFKGLADLRLRHVRAAAKPVRRAGIIVNDLGLDGQFLEHRQDGGLAAIEGKVL